MLAALRRLGSVPWLECETRDDGVEGRLDLRQVAIQRGEREDSHHAAVAGVQAAVEDLLTVLSLVAGIESNGFLRAANPWRQPGFDVISSGNCRWRGSSSSQPRGPDSFSWPSDRSSAGWCSRYVGDELAVQADR